MTVLVRILSAALVVLTGVGVAGCGSRQEFGVPDAATPGNGGQVRQVVSGVGVTVIDASAKPLSGAFVAVKDAAGRTIASDVKTDAEGRVNFAKLPPGKGYQAIARVRGVSAAHLFDVEGEVPVLVTILLTSSHTARGTVGGTVFDGVTGVPLHGAMLTVVGVQGGVRSNADGSFILKGVPVGNPIVTATYPGFRDHRVGVPLKAGASMRADFRMQPMRTVNRLGHTLIATTDAVWEVDRAGSRLQTLRRGASQARILPNGNVLFAGVRGVEEVAPGGSVVWAYKPLRLGRLGNPQGAFRAQSGNTFIADTDNHRVLEVSTSQQIQRVLTIDLNKPMSVERLEASKTTLIADTGQHRIVEVDDAGRLVWGFGDGDVRTLNRPTHVTRLPNGNTLVTDTGNSRILEITPDHKLAWSYGGDGLRTTCFLPNSAVRLPNGNTLIADTGNQRVIEVSPALEVVWQVAAEAPQYAERF